MTKPILILALVFCSMTVAFGQGRPEWIARFETTIKSKEPLWKITDRLVNDDPAGYSESFRLTKNGVSGAVEISAYIILTNPIETFQGLVTAHDNMTKGTTKTRLTGLGDEAYMWANRDPNAHATVYVRKGKTFVQIFLPGKSTAQRFAKLVADQMP